MDSPFRHVYTIESLGGGLNDKYEPNIIADDQSPDCKNVIFDNRGGMKTRNGYSKVNTTTVGSFAGDGLFTARFQNATEKMVGFWNGTGYALSTTTFITIPSAQSVFTAGVRVDACMYQNSQYYGNGFSIPYKYNGTDFTRQGTYAPNSFPTTTSGTAGVSGPAGGDVQYKVTYVNSSLIESDVSTAATTLTIASTGTVSLAALPVAPQSFGVAARRVYRKSTGSGGSFKLVGTVNDNTTTTLLDQVTDSNLGATAPTDQGVPPLWQYSVTHQERVWMVSPTNPSYLYYSELGNPFVVKATNFILISDGDSEIITGIGVHNDMLVVYKQASIWLIYFVDTTPGNWKRIKSNSRYGLATHYAQADYQGKKMFLGQRYGQLSGFLALYGIDTAPDSSQLVANTVTSDTKSDPIEPDVFNFNTGNIAKSCAIEYRNKLYFSVPYTTSSVPNRLYVFDFQQRTKANEEGSWVPFTYPNGIAAFCIYGGALYGQSSTANGFVYKLLPSTTYSDDGTAIDSYGWTKEFFGKDSEIENWKDFRLANFLFETLGTYYMSLTFKVDGDSGVGTTVQINLSPGGATWGAFNWGAALWGSGTTFKKYRTPLGPLSGKRIQFKFSNQNTVNQGFHVLPLGSFQYNLRGVR